MRVWFALAAMVAGATSAPAAEGGEDQEGDPIELAPVQVTAGRAEAAATEVPQAVTVVTHAQIERQSPQTWTDLLRGQAGAFVQASGPGQGIVIVRGLKGSEVLHLVDGMRLNNAFFRNSPSQYIALVDPYNIERVELQRGPGATLYGSDALGGVVQILTPEYRFHGDAWDSAGKLRLQYGSADLSRIARAEGAVGNDTVSFAGGYTVTRYGERDLGDGGREPLTDYLARGYDAKLLYTPADAHEVMLSGSFFEYPKLARYFDVVGGPGGAGDNVQSYFKPNDRQFIHLRYRYRHALGPVRGFEAHLAQQVIDDERLRQPNSSRIDTEQNRSTLTGLTLQAYTPLTQSLHLQYGLDLYSDIVDSAKQRTPFSTGVTEPAISTYPDGARQDTQGVYLNAQWWVTPDWQLDAGLRYSRVETDLSENAVSDAAQFSDDDVTWQLGALRRLTPQLSWTATAARGFRAPNLFDLGTLGPRSGSEAEQVNVPNTDLQPETVTSIDSGLRWAQGRVRLELTAFYTDYDQRIEAREPTGNTIPEGELGCSAPDGCVEVQSRNIAQARYWGIESAARWHAGSFSSYAVLNWTYGQELRSGEPTTPANRIPPLNGQVGVALDLAHALSVEAYILFAGAQQRLDDDDRNDTRIDPEGTPGWATLNLRGVWQVRPWLDLQVEGRNLLDQAYREHGSGVDAAGAGLMLGTTARF
ncbi:TonB-dependent receptor [Sinimarinibacterium sp. CAU 1509]|uniref:TonB-dependent receptor plug domain-containing protein n=1 Tax=Sinimarinibacterium sp. CAU 1509 TaxID=2562283 RepID=UPI0010AD4171|nr:TonB-dependent receptor [Sinimarinibacterium sp. CAU 1509]TJY63214.1 TonB-dependent receptor [Sinimarinibacterium sp. CAU 1509]